MTLDIRGRDATDFCPVCRKAVTAQNDFKLSKDFRKMHRACSEEAK
jgi:hypothetical protein